MRTAAAFGFGAASFSAMTQAELAEAMTGDRVEYVAAIRTANGDPEPMYRTMERDEWVRRRAAVRLMERIQTQLDKRFDDRQLTAAFVPDDDSHTGFGVEVEYITDEHVEGTTLTPDPSIETVRKALPETGAATVGKGSDAERVAEMPITVTDVTHRQVGFCQETSGVNYNYIPGGIPIAVDDGSTDGIQGSLAAAYDDADYGAGWLTAGHVGGSPGLTAYYPEISDAWFGDVKKTDEYNSYRDLAFINDPSNGWTGHIADATASGGYDFDIIGYLTDTELENDVGTSTTYHTQGRTTCRHHGTMGGTTTYGWQADMNVNPGDSGGSYFKKAGGGDVYMGGHVTRQRGWIGDNAGGCKASTVIELFGGTYLP